MDNLSDHQNSCQGYEESALTPLYWHILCQYKWDFIVGKALYSQLAAHESLVAAPLTEKPIEHLKVLIGLCPGIVTDSGIFGVSRVATYPLERLDHIS